MGDRCRVTGWQGDRTNDSPTPCHRERSEHSPITTSVASNHPSPITLAERRVGERQFHLEFGADRRGWISGQCPAVGGDDAARQVEPDPEPRGPRSASEAIEETREEFRRNTRPLIGNGHHRPTSRAG